MNILLLGGTNEARVFARRAYRQALFDHQQHTLVYSVAGLVRQPDVPCLVISGGFTQYGGLAAYIASAGIHAVLDMTHPYAVKISLTAMQVCQAMALPYWRFLRDPWIAEPDDHWLPVSSWAEVVDKSVDFTRILLTVGQLDQDKLTRLTDVISTKKSGKLLLRTATPLSIALPENMIWIQATGPFDVESERRLLKTNAIDCLVTKNSGGDATRAKLTAARELGVAVIMQNRPVLPPVDPCFNSIDQCLVYLANVLYQSRYLHNSKTHPVDLDIGNHHAL
ncbi:MAG: cobalt-precorrin-6A reductase [Gammaproteobacteria bacterium]|nr:MAG: cobalt-precorrin-6A reductase [Gammaproteobacteria bacterium]